MSQPKIPDINPNVTLRRSQAVDMLLASIALEDMGMAQIINAEAEKIQSVLGTLPGQLAKDPDLADLEVLGRSVGRILRDTIRKTMLLQFQLETVMDIPEPYEDE